MQELQGVSVSAVRLLFGGVSAWLLAAAVWNLVAGLKSRAWPSTSGTITTSELAKDSSNPFDFTHRRANVEYRYNVNGKDYLARGVFVGDSWTNDFSRPAATRRVVKYSRGSTVTVYYDPLQPWRAVLEPGVNWQTWYQLAFAVLFAAGVVFLALQSQNG